MATDQEISQALQSLIRDSSTPNKPNAPALTSFNDVVHQLQSKLGVDLSHRLDFIRAQIRLLLYPSPPPQHVAPPPPPPTTALAPPKDHFVLHPHHHHPQQPPNFHPSPSAFHSFPPVRPDLHAQHHPHVHQVQPVSLPAKESAPAKGKRRGGPGGLNKLCNVSPELQAVVGQPAMPRTEIVKQLWAYIRKNNLQDPNNKRKIICNDELRLVFETDCTDMFKMNKLLAKHISPMEPTKASESKKLKVDPDSGVRSSTDSGPSVKISEELANFFGVSEPVMLQSEITRRIWEYINVNQLQDPRNSMTILCDAKLQEIFGCESIQALGIPEVLAERHLIRRS
ncbi:la-related protein 6B-like [Syzygium oleosum]|uniref:la-related protein 6B-like n=1 Tax=Syzygium oleosum TaxID=219896 RepID=UPI0011D1F440|nr:la-related protein 6B-like [Syzygium oleosum]